MHGRLVVPRLNRMAELADPYLEATARAACEEANLIERAVSWWAEQCEVTPEEFSRYFWVKVDRRFDGNRLVSSVEPRLFGEKPSWRIKPKVPS